MMLLAALLIAAPAWADPAVEHNGDGVQGPLAAGVVVGPLKAKSWVLSDAYYSKCLTLSLDVESLTGRLDKCTQIGTETNARALEALEVAGKALAVANGQMDADGSTVNDLTLKVLEAERAGTEKDAVIARLRAQRNVAWAVTGGVTLAIIGAAAIAIGG